MAASSALAAYDCSNKSYNQMEADHTAIEKTRTLLESENPTDLNTMKVIAFLYEKQTEITKCQTALLKN